ncbi:MAG: hypothetical protein PHE51_09090 [Eubacteriales bacterium]|nr:hypothetical protein [Eubacteriales bacterium]
MKKIIVLFMFLFLTGCAISPTNTDTPPLVPTDIQTVQPKTTPESLVQTSNVIKPIIVYGNSVDRTGYVVGGLINGKMVNLQDKDNYKLFDLTGQEKYMFFATKGNPVSISGESFKTSNIAATGTYEIRVSFKDIDKLPNLENTYIGIVQIGTCLFLHILID